MSVSVECQSVCSFSIESLNFGAMFVRMAKHFRKRHLLLYPTQMIELHDQQCEVNFAYLFNSTHAHLIIRPPVPPISAKPIRVDIYAYYYMLVVPELDIMRVLLD